MNEYTRKLLDKAIDMRLIGDYQVDTHIEAAIIADMINQAREFLEAAQAYLEK